MKTRYALIFIVLLTCLLSCQKEEMKPLQQTGKLHVELGLFIQVNEINRSLKSTQQTEDFRVCIYSDDGTEILSFERASEMPAEIELETGDYYVAAFSDNNLPAAFDNPYYYGESDVFTIGSNEQRSVPVNCELANTIVSIVYSDRVMNSFTDYTTTVASSLGSLVFLKDESRSGYFQPMPLSIAVLLTYQKHDGSFVNKTLTGNIADVLPKRHYEIHVDASINEGTATFQISLDEIAIQTEIIEINSEDDNQQTNGIGPGELLITEIMFNPSALADTEGEWFEVYNNSNRTINIQNLVIERDDINTHTVNESIDILPASYLVFERTSQATNAEGYVYGSGISLTNTGAVLSLFNEEYNENPGAMIFSVDYGAEDFPAGAGASIMLDPEINNAGDAMLGTSWCVSTSVYNTGDTGTPGVANDDCSP